MGKFNVAAPQFIDLPADTTIDISFSEEYFITKGGSFATITVPIPDASADGVVLRFTSTSAQAHVITFTGSRLQNGVTINRTTATLANVRGASIEVVARTGLWYVLSQSAAVTYA